MTSHAGPKKIFGTQSMHRRRLIGELRTAHANEYVHKLKLGDAKKAFADLEPVLAHFGISVEHKPRKEVWILKQGDGQSITVSVVDAKLKIELAAGIQFIDENTDGGPGQGAKAKRQ